jgi:uncharacterized protein (TIGR03492 family)
MKLLCLSNGHGEDVIATRIVQELQQQTVPPEIVALPIVGEGRAYTRLGITILGPARVMPSGGFIYMDKRQLLRDLQGGLVQLAWKQLKVARTWAMQGGKILAVGDIVPLLFAWLSGATYGFVGTAKSEYYLRDESAPLSGTGRRQEWSGSVYLPWERWLMSHPRCKAVFPRDRLTTEILQQWAIPAFDLGNPMMDGLEPQFLERENSQAGVQPQLTIVLLPGSRPPEAYNNWQQIVTAITGLVQEFASIMFLGAIAPGLNLEPLGQTLQSQGWRLDTQAQAAFNDPTALTFIQANATLLLTQHAYNDCLHQADLAIAMAGTATEQVVGLGKPAIAMPGSGPQFTPRFAEAQTRLLGPSCILVDQPAQVAAAIKDLMENPNRLSLIAENGLRRMGQPGAARRIATCLMEQLIR